LDFDFAVSNRKHVYLSSYFTEISHLFRKKLLRMYGYIKKSFHYSLITVFGDIVSEWKTRLTIKRKIR